MNSIQIILIEDEEQVRVQLRAALRSQNGIEVASEATNAVTGLVLLESIDVNVAVVDASLPDMDLLEFLEQMQRIQADSSVVPSKVLILASSDKEQKLNSSLMGKLIKEGVFFCPKNAPISQITEAIQRAHRGDHQVPSEFISGNNVYEI